MFGTRKSRTQSPSPYATKGDFCRIFKDDMSRLYRLSFLLTGDSATAEHCFVGGLHSAQNGSQVFKEWAESWARRMIIQNAIRLVRPGKAAGVARAAGDRSNGDAPTAHPEIARVVELPAFERFAFVMSVLERYSDQECSLLLGCTRGDVAAARTRAFQRLGESADLQRKLMNITSNQKTKQGQSLYAPELTAAGPALAASA